MYTEVPMNIENHNLPYDLSTCDDMPIIDHHKSKQSHYSSKEIVKVQSVVFWKGTTIDKRLAMQCLIAIVFMHEIQKSV